MRLYLAFILCSALSFGLGVAAANELSGLDAQQRDIVVIDGPKDGGAIIVHQENGLPPPNYMSLEEAIAIDRATNAEGAADYKMIRKRLENAIEAPIPAVEAATQGNTTMEAVDQTP